eukprot:15139272-Alexandrium_andersonii.AAC.1
MSAASPCGLAATGDPLPKEAGPVLPTCRSPGHGTTPRPIVSASDRRGASRSRPRRGHRRRG